MLNFPGCNKALFLVGGGVALGGGPLKLPLPFCAWFFSRRFWLTFFCAKAWFVVFESSRGKKTMSHKIHLEIKRISLSPQDF